MGQFHTNIIFVQSAFILAKIQPDLEMILNTPMQPAQGLELILLGLLNIVLVKSPALEIMTVDTEGHIILLLKVKQE